MFFFSSRRRHTRWPRDWSSDVCSSDLFLARHCWYWQWSPKPKRHCHRPASVTLKCSATAGRPQYAAQHAACTARSEERRVGKEDKSLWEHSAENKKSTKQAY